MRIAVNDTAGPMEELRICFGPKSYFLTEFINASFLYLATIFYLITSDNEKKSELLGTEGQEGTLIRELKFVAKLITAYEREEGAFLEQQLKILQNSPFFVTKEQIGGLSGPGEEKEVLVAKVHEERVKVDATDELVWEWLTKNKDIEFFVSFIKEGSTSEQIVKPKERYESHTSKVTGTLL